MSEMTVVWIFLTVITALMIVYQITFGGYMKASEELIEFLRERNGSKDAIIEKQERLIGLQKEKIETLEEFVTKMNAGGQ